MAYSENRCMHGTIIWVLAFSCLLAWFTFVCRAFANRLSLVAWHTNQVHHVTDPCGEPVKCIHDKKLYYYCKHTRDRDESEHSIVDCDL